MRVRFLVLINILFFITAHAQEGLQEGDFPVMSLPQFEGIHFVIKDFANNRHQLQVITEKYNLIITERIIGPKYAGFAAIIPKHKEDPLEYYKQCLKTCEKLEKYSPIVFCELDVPDQLDFELETQCSHQRFWQSFPNFSIDLEGLSQSFMTAAGQCPLLDSPYPLDSPIHYDGAGNETLSSDWARQRTGADLAVEFMRENQMGTEQQDLVILDSEQTAHMQQVRGLLSDSTYLGDLNQHDINFREQILSASSRNQRTRFIIEDLHGGNMDIRSGAIVNISMTVNARRERSAGFAFDHMANAGLIAVTTAGNRHLRQIPDYKIKAAQEDQAIVVGSTSPLGLTSHFSQSAPPDLPTIMAPGSDMAVPYIDQDGNQHYHANLNGTSWSAPQVSAALSNVQRLLDHHLDVESSRVLLQQSSIPTKEQLRGEGPGMLNSYKMVQVAAQIRAECIEGQSLNERDQRRCIHTMVHDPETYQFQPDMDILENAREKLPGCNGTSEQITDLSCEEQKEAFNQLRQEYFLHPDNREIIRCLEGIYINLGLTSNASYYQMLGHALDHAPDIPPLKKPNDFFELPPPRSTNELSSYLRAHPELFDDEHFRAMLLADDPDHHVEAFIENDLAHHGERGMNLLQEIIESSGDNFYIQEIAIVGLGKIVAQRTHRVEGERGLSPDQIRLTRQAATLLENYAQSENEHVRGSVARKIHELPNGAAIFALMQDDPSVGIRADLLVAYHQSRQNNTLMAQRTPWRERQQQERIARTIISHDEIWEERPNSAERGFEALSSDRQRRFERSFLNSASPRARANFLNERFNRYPDQYQQVLTNPEVVNGEVLDLILAGNINRNRNLFEFLSENAPTQEYRDQFRLRLLEGDYDPFD